MRLIKHGAFHYELRESGHTELQALVHESTITFLPAAAWEFLKSKGHEPKSPAAAYSLLVSSASQEDADRTGTKVLEKIKTTLDDPFETNVRQKRQDT